MRHRRAQKQLDERLRFSEAQLRDDISLPLSNLASDGAQRESLRLRFEQPLRAILDQARADGVGSRRLRQRLRQGHILDWEFVFDELWRFARGEVAEAVASAEAKPALSKSTSAYTESR